MRVVKGMFFRVWWLSAVAAMAAMAQTTTFVETKNFADKTLGGECVLKSAKLSVDGQSVRKAFEIDVGENGDYYLNAWIMGGNTSKGLQVLEVYLDNASSPSGDLAVSSTGWQSAKLVNSADKSILKLVSLTAGTHTISFQTEVPYTPAVDFIRLAKDKERSVISDIKYRTFIDSLKSLRLPSSYAKTDGDTASVKLMRVLPNPQGDYAHEIEMNCQYTYYGLFYFYAGSPVVFETKKADPYASNPVMELFNADDPVNRGSWVDDDGGEGYQSKISCTVQYTGYYYLLLWSWWLGTSGTTDLYLYDNLYAANVPLTHNGLRSDHTPTEVLNYFTCRITTDTRIWIEDQSGFPGRIKGYNDDYGSGGGDFYWGLASRVKKQFPMAIRAAQLSTYSSYNPTGVCDIYVKMGSSYAALHPYFPNLKEDDAIRSAPASGTYNCISWSGGITSYWEWPPSAGSRYYVPGNTLASFDNYYGNNPVRYSGSEGWTYTRSGATADNNQIDLWALNGSYTHGSVYSRWDNIPIRSPANGHPHGYAWESKPGGLMRTLHPRHALNGSSYGDVVAYYKKTDVLGKFAESMTSEESIRRGLSALDNVELTAKELNTIAALKSALSNEEILEFNNKYSAWKETWTDPEISIYSDPRKYAESGEYSEFLKYCIAKDKKVFPLLLEKLNQDDAFVMVPLEDLTYTGNEALMEQVHGENLESQYTKEGVFVIHTLIGNWMKYGEKLLAHFDEYKGFTPKTEQSGSIQNINIPKNEIMIQNYPNPFNPSTQIRYGVPLDSRITVKIYDILGREVAVLANNEFRNAGWHIVSWDGRGVNGSQVSSGVYFCRITSGSQARTLKLLMVR